MGDDDSVEGPGPEKLKHTLLKSPSRLSLEDTVSPPSQCPSNGFSLFFDSIHQDGEEEGEV